jgi:hypothetical protein
MGRPKKLLEDTFITITLQDFEDLWCKHRGWQRSVPMELSPMWSKYVAGDPTAENRLYQQRRAQLHELEMLHTHQIDYYIGFQEKQLNLSVPLPK